ncbi:hypothetical protein COBT_001987 [Conglomerata obtusa]
MNNKDYWASINKIMQTTKCTQISAIEALYTTSSLNDAMNKAKDSSYYIGGGSSGLAVQDNKRRIVQYENGILIEEKFYPFSSKNNSKLKNMLERGEFEAELLGGKPGDDIAVKYMEIKNINYDELNGGNVNEAHVKEKQPDEIKKKENTFNIKEVEFPNEIVIDDGNEIKFKIFVGYKKINVKTKSTTKIHVLLGKLSNFHTEPFYLTKNNVKVDENESCDVLKNSLVVLVGDKIEENKI